MKKILAFLVCTVTMFGCGYDDTNLRNEIDDIRDRLESLEATISSINSQVTELKTIVDYLKGGKVVLNVLETENGYILEMSDGSKLTITNGKDGKDGENGKDGKDGLTPQIGVKQDTDGEYYWTVNGEWLLDSNGNKVRANAKDGQDGHTPQIGVKQDTDGEYYWTVDGKWLLDENQNKIKAVGKDGEKGEKGDKGDSLISSITDGDTSVTIVLADGTELVLPKLAGASLKFKLEGDAECYWGDTLPLELEAENIISATVTTPDGWSGRVNLTSKKAFVTAPWVTENAAETEGYIGIIAVTKDNQSVVISKKISASYNLILNTAYKTYSDLANHIVDEIIPQHATEDAPYDAILNFPSVNDAFFSLKLTNALKETVPSITMNTHGSTFQFNIGASSTCLYDGVIYVNAGKDELFSAGGYIYPKKASFVANASFTRFNGIYSKYVKVCKDAVVETMTLSQAKIFVMNFGTINTLSSAYTTEIANFGTIGSEAGSGAKSHIQYRPVTTVSKPYIGRVLNYQPAPGQYGAGTYASKGNEGGLVTFSSIGGTLKSLGMYGGEVIFQFDHTVFNNPGYDFVIRGNAMATSNEPGAVQVSYDANHNGIADDEWYELAGCHYNDPETIHDYVVTYVKDVENNRINWTDNKGGSGFIGHNGTAKPVTWWPAFDGDTLVTKSGTFLGGIKSMYYPVFKYGYVDTYSPEYTVKLNNDTDTSNTNKFMLEWAVDAAGNPVSINAIDFVRVYSCTFTIDNDYPAFNEISTEIAGAKDLGFNELPKLPASDVDKWQSGSSF